MSNKGILGDGTFQAPPSAFVGDAKLLPPEMAAAIAALGKDVRSDAINEQCAELAKMLHDVLRDEILFEIDRTFETSSERDIYKSDFAAFREWCTTEGLPCLPSYPEVVAHYVVSRAADMPLEVLKRAVEAIGFINYLKDTPLPAGDILVPAALRWAGHHQAIEADRTSEETARETNEPSPPQTTNGRAH